MYQNGRGVPQSDQEAVKWYRLAAEQGNSFGQNNLGFMYQNGRGVPQSDQEAIKWYRLAAEQGNSFALERLLDYENKKDQMKTHKTTEEKTEKKSEIPLKETSGMEENKKDSTQQVGFFGRIRKFFGQ